MNDFPAMLKATLELIEFNDWRFEAIFDGTKGVWFLRVVADDDCNATGKPYTWKGRKWLLSEHMTRNEIINTAFKAVMTAIEHEAREQFLYRGQMVLGGHLDYDQIADHLIARGVQALDVRQEPAISLEEYMREFVIRPSEGSPLDDVSFKPVEASDG